MQKPTLSIIIPARSEFPQIVFTLYSILHSLEVEGFKPHEFEIIIVDNCSDDRKMPQRGTWGTIDYLRTRGAYHNRVIRTVYYPLAGNHTARNIGAEMARGKYLFFSDAHMAYQPGYFRELIRAIDESGGIVHGVLDWLGAYPPTKGGTTYTIKLGEEIKGTWANYRLRDREGKIVDDWWYIPALGHCSLGMLREQFLDFGGYQNYHRCYGGGEFFLNFKWWMFGSTVAVNPKCVGYHLSAGRGYSYNHDDYIHNVLYIGYALGMDEWTERAYINWLRRGRKEVMEKKRDEAWKECQEDRKFVAERRKYTFNEIITSRPWKKKNIEKHGSGIDSLQIFHDTWLDLLKSAPPYCQEMYNNSQMQKDLEVFINTHLNEFVYKRKQ